MEGFMIARFAVTIIACAIVVVLLALWALFYIYIKKDKKQKDISKKEEIED